MMNNIRLNGFDKNQVFAGRNIAFENISIVGNSGILKGSDLGKQIDEADCVVRLNSAPTNGYEADVGSKTTFRVINALLQKGKTLRYTTTPRHWLQQVRNHRLIWVPVSPRSEQTAEKLTHESNIVYELTPQFKSWIRDDVTKELGRFCSTGLFSVLLFSCLGRNLNMYGFGFHQEKLEDRHYWETWNDSHDNSHQWKKEMEIMTNWDQQEPMFNIW